MSFFQRIFGRAGHQPDVTALWSRIVEIAREKDWYARCGVADTVPGRFDAVTLVLALVMMRMDRDRTGDDSLVVPSSRLTEHFVEDMDGQLRESGVGDLVVGKRMGKLVSVLAGRIEALKGALDSADPIPALGPVLNRNVTMREDAGEAERERLAERVLALHRRIDATGAGELLSGDIAREAQTP